MRLYITLILTFLTASSIAQLDSFNLSWGSNSEKRNWANGFIGDDSSSVYTILFSNSGKNKKITVSKINKLDLTKTLTFEHIVPVKEGINLEFEDIFYKNGTFIGFYSGYDRNTATYSLYVQQYNNNGAKTDIKLIKTEKVENKKNRGKYNFGISSHSNEIIGYYTNRFTAKNTLDINYFLVDNNASLIIDTTISLPSSAEFNIVKTIYTQDENIFLLTHNGSLENPDQNSINKKYKVFGYFGKQDITKEYELSLGTKWITSASLITDQDGNPLISGYYSDFKRYGFAGTFFLKIDRLSRKINVSSLTPFPDVIFNPSITKSKKEELNDYYFEKFILKADGGVYLIAQENYIEISSSMDPNTRTVAYNYFYNYLDIIVTNIDKEGNVIWSKRIPKKQITMDDNGLYSSFAVLGVKNDLAFLYSDNPKNKDTFSDLKAMNNPRNAVVSLVTLTNSGSLKKTTLYHSKNTKDIFKPYLIHTDYGKRIIFATENGKSIKLAKIEFQ